MSQEAVNAPKSGQEKLRHQAHSEAAVARLLHLGATEGPWAENVWRSLQEWAEQDGLEVQCAAHGGCQYLVIRVEASRPAFAQGHRQALLISARLEPERGKHAIGDNVPGLAIARGCWLAVQGLAVAASLHQMQEQGHNVAARDLIVCIEIDQRHLSATPCRVVPGLIEQMLGRAAFVMAEWGGWSMHLGEKVAIPIAVAQKGRLLVRVLARGQRIDPAMPVDSSAIERLQTALSAVAEMPRPWRKTKSSKAFIESMAKLSGMGRGLTWRALLGGGAWASVLSRFPRANHVLLEALFHDTVTPVSLQADADGGTTGTVATATLDCRLLPGSTAAEFLDGLRACVGEQIEVSVLSDRPPLAAPLHSALLRTLQGTIQRWAPDAVIVPMLMTGTCDALGWRQSAVPCYGFSPMLLSADQDALRLWSTGMLAPSDEQLAWGVGTFLDAGELFCVSG